MRTVYSKKANFVQNVTFLVLLFCSSVNAAAAQNHTFLIADCQSLLLNDQDLNDLFDGPSTGDSILRFLSELDYQVQAQAAADPGAWSRDPKANLKLKLTRFFKTSILPLLERYSANSSLRKEADIDKQLLVLAYEEKLELLTEFKPHYSELMSQLLTLAGLNQSVAIIEISNQAKSGYLQPEIDGLTKMYIGYAKSKGWKVDILAEEEGHVSLQISGSRAFSLLSTEAGTHRFISRGDETAIASRKKDLTFTRYADVRVYPQLDLNASVKIDQAQLEITTFRSRGPGGQNVNKTETGVRVKDRISGLQVRVDRFRSQGDNMRLALQLIQSKIDAQKREEQEQLKQNLSRSVGAPGASVLSANAVAYVRTYDGRYQNDLESILEGDIDHLLQESLRQRMLEALPDLLKPSGP